jgi:hypothetical protein
LNHVFAVVIETTVDEPGRNGRIVLRCSDGTIIDDKFDSNLNLPALVGEIVIVGRAEDGAIKLWRVSLSQSQPVPYRQDRSDAVSGRKQSLKDPDKFFWRLSRDCRDMMKRFKQGRKEGWEQTLRTTIALLKQPRDHDNSALLTATRNEYASVRGLLVSLERMTQALKEYIISIESYLGILEDVAPEIQQPYESERRGAYDCCVCFYMVISLWYGLNELPWSDPIFEQYGWGTMYDLGADARTDAWFSEMINGAYSIDLNLAEMIVNYIYPPR